MNNENENNWWEKQPSILFVDDEKSILKSLGRVFRSANYELHFAESGKKALDILKKIPIDVVVSDQRMPGMTGTDLLKVVNERWPHIMRVVLSGYTDVDSLLSAINEGEVYRFVTKPWNDKALERLVAKCIEEGKILKGFIKLVGKLSKVAPNHRIEAVAEIEKGRLNASLHDHGKKLSREQMALLIPVLLDNINEQFGRVDTEKLGGLIAKRMGKINFSAEVGAGIKLSVDIPVAEGTEEETP